MIGYVDTYVSKAMARYIQEYVDFCRNVAAGADRVWVEAKVNLYNFIDDGFGTVDFAVLKGDRLHIIDLKYGKGVQVDADTPQAKYYAVALIDTFQLCPAEVTVTIHQPRLGHISTATFSFFEIMAFADLLKERALVVDKMDKAFRKGKPMKFEAGAHCGFCRAKRQCRALRDYVVKQGPLTTEGFTKITELPLGKQRDQWVDSQVQLLSDEELAEYFIWADLAIRTANAIKGVATSRAASGKQYKGLKLVAGRASRDWKNNDKAAEMLLQDQELTEDQIYKKTLVSPSQAEKLIGGKLSGHELVSERPGKPALVLKSDRRKEIASIQSADNRGFSNGKGAIE